MVTAIRTATASALALATLVEVTATLAEVTATLAEVTVTVAEATGTRPIRPCMGVAHIWHLVLGVLIAAHIGDGASFANVSLPWF